MNEDLGYSGEDWVCCSESPASSTNTTGWLSIAGLALGALALGTALYAAFAPRKIVEQGRQKVQSASSQAADKGREIADAAREAISAHTAGMSGVASAPGL